MTVQQPFRNGTEWEAWADGWCYQCEKEATCPLLDIVFLDEETPKDWLPGDVGALGPRRYTCTAFRRVREEHGT